MVESGRQRGRIMGWHGQTRTEAPHETRSDPSVAEGENWCSCRQVFVQLSGHRCVVGRTQQKQQCAGLTHLRDGRSLGNPVYEFDRILELIFETREYIPKFVCLRAGEPEQEPLSKRRTTYHYFLKSRQEFAWVSHESSRSDKGNHKFVMALP